MIRRILSWVLGPKVRIVSNRGLGHWWLYERMGE